MPKIKSIQYRRILNSHVKFTNEFVLQLEDGSVGIGSSPLGETKSIYEGQASLLPAKTIIAALKRDGILKAPIDQKSYDKYLLERVDQFGRDNVFSLSVAFFNAANTLGGHEHKYPREGGETFFPHLCINFLNGGMHAYTNPVASDFHEYLLIPQGNDLTEIIGEHEIIQQKIKEELSRKEKINIGKNTVNKIGAPSNRACIEFLLNILDKLNLRQKYELMIDAAGTDLWNGQQYHFAVTDDSLMSEEELCDYWLSLIREYDIRYLEDPFHEKDFNSWHTLLSSQDQCLIIGDDMHSGDAKRIQQYFKKRYMNGIILKPDQAGTVSDTIKAIEASCNYNMLTILSHRSISTESTFLSTIAHKYNIKHVKFGPMLTDYSSIIKINEIIRLKDAVNG